MRSVMAGTPRHGDDEALARKRNYRLALLLAGLAFALYLTAYFVAMR